MDVTNGGEHVSWGWGQGGVLPSAQGIPTGLAELPNGPKMAKPGTAQPLSHSPAYSRGTEVVSTFSPPSQDEHLTPTGSLHSDGQPGRQKGLSYCSTTRAGS